MFKKMPFIKSDLETLNVTSTDDFINLIDADKPGQKIIRFGRPDLVTGWVSDVATVSKKTQSQIMEEVILQQFVTRERRVQWILELLYSEDDINKGCLKALSALLSLRMQTGEAEYGEEFDYEPITKLIHSKMSGRMLYYDHDRFKKEKNNIMHHFMREFTACGQRVVEYATCNNACSPEGYEFNEPIEGWNDGEPKDWFKSWNFALLVGTISKYWNYDLYKFYSAYRALFDVTEHVLPIMGKEIFDVYDRLLIVEFINRLGDAIQEKNRFQVISPQGELYRSTKDYINKKGYNTKVFNLADRGSACAWILPNINWAFNEVVNSNSPTLSAERFASLILPDTPQRFWNKAEKDMLALAAVYTAKAKSYTGERDCKSMYKVLSSEDFVALIKGAIKFNAKDAYLLKDIMDKVVEESGDVEQVRKSVVLELKPFVVAMEEE